MGKLQQLLLQMSPSGGEPYRSPPIIRRRTSFPLVVMLRKVLGVLVTALFVLVVTIGIPICLVLCVIGFVKRKSRRWSYERGCCTHQWPICGAGPDLAGLIFTGSVDLETLNENIRRVVDDSDSNLYRNPSSDVSAHLGKVWDNSVYHLTSDADLLELQRDEGVLPRFKTSLSLVPEFSHSLKGLMTSSLVLTSTAADCAFVCVQRLLCMCLDERTTFEVEPHAPLMFGWQPHVLGGFAHTAVCMSIKFGLGGPFSLLVLALRGQDPVWKYLESKDHILARNRRRPPLPLAHHGSSLVLMMDTIPEDSNSEIRSPTHHEHRGSLFRNVPPPAAHRRCWMAVKHPELLLRAEKLLRATTSELFISLLAGTLRNYFREQGILHPPDVGFVTPSSGRGPAPIGDRCEMDLLSFQLPISVEGAIPRLWAVQRNVTKVMEGPVPGAVAILQTLARTCLPAAIAKCAFRVVYRSHAVYFAFYRINNFKVSGEKQVRTMFIFPSLSASVRAAFIFIQHASGIDVSVSLCSRTFPEPHRILESFHAGDEILVSKLEPNQDYSLEELYQLLDVVQNELDSMRSNPEESLRGHYIDRLTRLEEKMQSFHECISQKMNAENMGAAAVTADDEVGDAIASVLAPYRDEAGTSGTRRFSREYSRTETSATTSRKSSRASI